MTQHDHAEFDPNCYRCVLNLDEQEMFCCSLVKSNGPKVKWLHTTCHDYWDRLQTAAREVERLRANVSVLEKELDRERGLFPSDGVWLVTDGRRNSQRIAKIGEVPDPIAFAALARHRDAISGAVSRSWSAYQDSGSQAPIDVADAILRDVLRALDGLEATLTDDCELGTAGETAVVLPKLKWEQMQAEAKQLRTVVDAARHARRIHGNFNLHTAKCQDSPCVACDDLAEVELDAENELDMALVQLDRAKPS